jgi:lysophospholipase L1-like esterase
VQFSEIDGIHFDENGHKKFAALIAQEVKQIFN